MGTPSVPQTRTPTRTLSGGVLLRRESDAPASTRAASFDREVARLLRARLIIATALLIVGGAVSLLFGVFSSARTQGPTHPAFAPIYGLLGVEVVLLLVLFRVRQPSLRLLRWIEGAV